MPARAETARPVEQTAKSFGQVFQYAHERIGPALSGIVVRGIQNVGEMSLDALDAVVTAAAKTLESPAHYVINHPRSAAVAAGASALEVFGLAACGSGIPIEPPLPAEVQPADTGATATAIANSPNASESNLPISGAIPTSEPATIPTQSPVEQAIERGKIEITKPAEWEKYFTLVSASEARELLALAKEKGESRFLLPQFDVAGITNFEATNYESKINIGGVEKKMVYLLMRGFPARTVFYSSFDGGVKPIDVPNNTTTGMRKINISYSVSGDVAELQVPNPSEGNDILLGSLVRVKANSKLEEYPVTLGTPLFALPSDDSLNWDDEKYHNPPVPGKWQAAFYIIRNRSNTDRTTWDFSGATLKNALTKDGKFVIVAPTPPGKG